MSIGSLYINVESLKCTSETNIALNVNYMEFK